MRPDPLVRPERIANPGDPAPVNRDDVETHRFVADLGSAADVEGSGEAELALFLRADGLHRVRETRSGACANLDEDDARLITHDQIEFPEPAAKVAREQRKAARAKMIQSQLFGCAAADYFRDRF